MTEKEDIYEKELFGGGEMEEKFFRNRKILVDKAYIGSQNELRVIFPEKKPFNGFLILTKKAQNQKVSQDRVIAEN